MLKALWPEQSQEEREKLLRDNCDRMEQVEYMRYLDNEELAEIKDNLSDIDIDIDNIEVEKKEVNDGFAEQLKPLKIRKKEILQDLRFKARNVTEACYVLIDHDAKEVGYYNKSGILVQSRPLRPGENQQSIIPLRDRTGT